MSKLHILCKKMRPLFSDSMWSIAGLMFMNLIAQFVVYPFWRQKVGGEAYGHIVTYMSVINVLSVAIGSGCNYARMRQSSRAATNNREYNIFLSVVSILMIPLVFFLRAIHALAMDEPTTFFYFLLMVSMLWRYYADVQFRLSVDYKGFFLYYFCIGLGYLAGCVLYVITGFWPISLLVGEICGLLFVAVKGTVFKPAKTKNKVNIKSVSQTIFFLVSTNLLLNLIFNADRLLLGALSSGTAVTIYYLASLLGKTVSLITTPMNGVIVGYAARYKGKLTGKLLAVIIVLLVLLSLLATAGCVIASHILIPLLYPNDYEQARSFFPIANFSQVIYCTTNVLTTFLLCFMASKYQLLINVVYAAAFIGIGIPAVLYNGLAGFVWGLAAVNLIRALTAVLCGVFAGVDRTSEEECSDDK